MDRLPLAATILLSLIAEGLLLSVNSWLFDGAALTGAFACVIFDITARSFQRCLIRMHRKYNYQRSQTKPIFQGIAFQGRDW